MVDRIELVRKAGFQLDEILIDESAPDKYVELQAEVMNDTRFLYMRYAVRSGVGMRAAYEGMTHAYGVRALAVLRRFLDQPSMEKLEEILQTYSPDTVVELSSYPFRLGRLNWNTLFWEVRSGY